MGRRSTRQEITLSDALRARLEDIVNNPQSPRKHPHRPGTWRRGGSASSPKASTGCDPSSGEEADPRGTGEGPDRPVIDRAMSPPPAHVRVRALAGKPGMGYTPSSRCTASGRTRPRPSRCPATRGSNSRSAMSSASPLTRLILRWFSRWQVQALGRAREAPAYEAWPCRDTRRLAERYDLPARGLRLRHRQGRVERHRSAAILAFLDPVA